MHNLTYLPGPDLLALCTLGAQEVTTNGMYRLPHAIYYCNHIARVRLRELLAGDRE